MISGGVDSAVAVHRICEMGYKPDLFYIKIGMEGEGLSCTAEEDIELSTAVTACTLRWWPCKSNIGNLWWATPWSVPGGD